MQRFCKPQSSAQAREEAPLFMGKSYKQGKNREKFQKEIRKKEKKLKQRLSDEVERSLDYRDR